MHLALGKPTASLASNISSTPVSLAKLVAMQISHRGRTIRPTLPKPLWSKIIRKLIRRSFGSEILDGLGGSRH